MTFLSLVYFFLLTENDTPGWMNWLNYPGLEAWKFINLSIFVGAAIFLLRGKLAEALRVRGEGIKREIEQAQREREAALARLAEAEAILARLDADIEQVQRQATTEATEERQRLKAAADREIEKLRVQAQREMETAQRIAKQGLRRLLAVKTVEVARKTVQSQLRPEDDRRLVSTGIAEMRGNSQ